jgi:flavin-dependent dehydrogenase
MEQSKFSDVIIIGGGPAGTTAATLLQRRGWTVTLFEKEKHPRFHIGESLLPKNMPILEELGVLDEVRRIGVHKPGADFCQPDEPDEYRVFLFERALGDSPSHAYQVRRSEFDELLFKNCRESGINALEEHCVNRVELNDDGAHKVHVTDPDGGNSSWTCRYLIDASGRDTLLASQEKWKLRNRKHASAALFTHFEGVLPRPGKDVEDGNIGIYWFVGGWIWIIPLPDGATSIGAVCRPEYLQERRSSQTEFLLEAIMRCPGAWQRVKNAKPLMPAQATGNYSYSSIRHTGNGFALIGDAYAFVDPVFSSGVYLAMSSATQIVPVVELWLKGDLPTYKKSAKEYSDAVNRGIRTFSWFIYRFTTPAMARLFRNPRNVLGVEQAVISMLAGDVYGATEIRIRLFIFKILYAFSQMISAMQRKPAAD